MFRVKPRNNEQSVAAFNRFLNHAQAHAKEMVVTPMMRPALLDRLEAMPALMQKKLEVIRRELIYLTRRFTDNGEDKYKTQVESHVELIWQYLIVADKKWLESESTVNCEMECLREMLRAFQTLPDAFYCPLTHSVMREPIMFRQGCGHSYEKNDLVAWIAHCQEHNHPIVDPMTRQEVDGQWIANLALRDAIAAWPGLESADNEDDESDECEVDKVRATK